MAFTAELKKDFQKLIEKNNLSQGYILFGFGRYNFSEGGAEEKFLFSKELANFLEIGKWEADNRVLLDARILNAKEDGGIDLVRSASHFLWQKPVVSKKRTLIINNADNLTLPAQNAILKISEEPPAHALIILIVRDPEVLLPAVVSRFQKIYVHAQNNANQRIDANTAKKFLNSNLTQKKEMIKQVVENEDVENFVTELIFELQKDKLQNWKVLTRVVR